MSIELDDRRFILLMIIAIASVFVLLLWTALAYKCDAPLIGSRSSILSVLSNCLSLSSDFLLEKVVLKRLLEK